MKVVFDLGPGGTHLNARRLVITRMRRAGDDRAITPIYSNNAIANTTRQVTVGLRPNQMYQAVLTDRNTRLEKSEPQILNFHTGSLAFPGPSSEGQLRIITMLSESSSSSSLSSQSKTSESSTSISTSASSASSQSTSSSSASSQSTSSSSPSSQSTSSSSSSQSEKSSSASSGSSASTSSTSRSSASSQSTSSSSESSSSSGSTSTSSVSTSSSSQSW